MVNELTFRSKGLSDAAAAPIMQDYISPDLLRGYYLESLLGRRAALEAARFEIESGVEGSVAAVQRIARTLRSSGALFGLSEVSEAARLVAEGTGSLLSRVDDLILAIDRASANTEATTILLVVDPDPDNAALLSLVLSAPSREVITAATAAEAERVLQTYSVSYIIMELDLPDDDGRNLLVRCRARTRTAETPILVLSKWDSPQVKTECLAIGAHAFYGKPFDPAGISSLVSARLARRTSVESKDALTGLPDYVALTEAFDRIRSLDDLASHSLCVAVIDFDHFRSLNAVYGRSAGDEVLRRGSEIISRMLRGADILARWEGQRFVVLLPDTDLEQAAEVLERTLQSLRQERFVTANGRTLRVSFSAGLELIDAKVTPLASALNSAMHHLRLAKQDGRGRIFTPHTTPSKSKQAVLVVEDDEIIAKLLEYRLTREGFHVHHFTSGSQAYRAAQELDVDLVLLDVRIPGMDGFELLERLRMLPAYANTPIIMLTGMGSENDLIRGFELGADDYMLKPFSPIELVARVKRALQRGVR